jgi:hypothetical protein
MSIASGDIGFLALLAAEGSTAHAALAPVGKDQWWDKAQASGIATASVAGVRWTRNWFGSSGNGWRSKTLMTEAGPVASVPGTATGRSGRAC